MRHPMTIARTLGLLAGLLLAPQPALALKVLTEENPPLNYTENKKLTGMATEVVQEMGKRAKTELDFEVIAWSKAYERAQADKETCLYSTARLPNRERTRSSGSDRSLPTSGACSPSAASSRRSSR